MVDRHRPLLHALAVAACVFAALALVGALAAALQLRSQVTAASGDLTRIAADAGDLPPKVGPNDVQAYLAAIPAPARLVGRFGQDVAATGPAAGLWDRAGAGWAARSAVTGADVTLLDGAVEVRRALANGRTVVLRRDIGAAATSVSAATAAAVGAVALVIALIAGAFVYLRERRRATRLAGVTAAAESLAAGRHLEPDQIPGDGDLARLGTALRTTGDRLEHLGEVADRELAVLSAAIEPLPVGVAGRGPTGGRLRNLALERLVEGLPPADRTAIDTAIQDGLGATGPIGTRVDLADGRLMDVDGWSVPGGRLVSVSERTEQERLANLRRQLEGSAIRQLRAPIDEIKARGADLYQQLPAPAAPTLRRLFAATDRLDRVVRMMLRGTAHDPALRPPRREVFGVAGLLWGMVHDWDAALRQRALRVELDIAQDLPDVRTDAALVEEILTELVDNAAKYTPRGGTVSISARRGDGAVAIIVSDTGSGFSDEDVPHATRRFFRGEHSESIPGAGLGLGVAAALAERLGGAIIVEPGPGGRVRLEIPVAPQTTSELVGVG